MGFHKVVRGPKMSCAGFYMDSKWNKKLCANRILHEFQSGPKSVLNESRNCGIIATYVGVKQVLRRTLKGLYGFYAGLEIVPRVGSYTGFKQIISGPKEGSIVP